MRKENKNRPRYVKGSCGICGLPCEKVWWVAERFGLIHNPCRKEEYNRRVKEAKVGVDKSGV